MEKDCPSITNFSYTWPGRRVAYACATHMNGIIGLARVMGVPEAGLNITLLSSQNIKPNDWPDGWPPCGNKVKEK